MLKELVNNMENLKDSKIESVRFHAAANIGQQELNSVQLGKARVVEISFAMVGTSCAGVMVRSTSDTGREYLDIVPMGDITRIRLAQIVVAKAAETPKAGSKKASE